MRNVFGVTLIALFLFVLSACKQEADTSNGTEQLVSGACAGDAANRAYWETFSFGVSGFTAHGSPLTGGELRVWGQGFSPNTQVTIGGRPCVNPRYELTCTYDQIFCQLDPTPAGEYLVSLTNPDGTTLTDNSTPFNFDPVPTVVSLSETKAPTDSLGGFVYIDGSGFLNTRGETLIQSVLFGDVPCDPMYLHVSSNTRLSCKIPSHSAGTVSVTVINRAGDRGTLANAFEYVYLPPPTITSINPAASFSVGGNLVVITGTGFNQLASFYAPGTPVQVLFGEAPATIIQRTETSLTVRVPRGAIGTVSVKFVDELGVVANLSNGFQYIANPQCGGPGNGCYDNAFATSAGFANLPDGTAIEYVTAANSFKVWKKMGGSEILNATGLWSSSSDWQQTLESSGSGYSGALFRDYAKIAGRACPTSVYLSSSDIAATNRCLYYDNGNPSQTLGFSWGYPRSSSWFVGNVSVCSGKGMRLPTLYEVNASSAGYFNLPSPQVLFGGTRVPVHSSGKTWTATTYIFYQPSPYDPNFFSAYTGGIGGFQPYPTHYENTAYVRCVLP